MIILGIADSHESHACIVRDGELIAAIAEERLSRLKADSGYPRLSVEAVIKMAGIKPEEIDVVAFAGRAVGAYYTLYKRNALFSVQDWVHHNRHYWKPKLLENKPLTPADDFELFKHLRGAEMQKDPYYAFIERSKNVEKSQHFELFNQVRAETVSKHLGISKEKVKFYRHEDCHKAYGYYSDPDRPETSLIFTLEGGGDDSSATVSIAQNNQIKESWKSNAVHLGRLYRNMTLLLGMKPGQHEYKVMGLAPHGTEYHGKRSLEYFRKINFVKGTEILDYKELKDLYFTIRDALEGERFDGIAWGVQTYVEEVLCEWIANNCKTHGIGQVVLSGGVAQNIKACKRVGELPEVKRIWVGPISGDGSLGIGAAWIAHAEKLPQVKIKGLTEIYLGTGATQNQIDAAITARNPGALGFEVISQPTPAMAAEWLDSGNVLARYSGRMEFGQRALGNRSILADPRRHESVERINAKIKYRDFWMPFTPSMLNEDATKLLVNDKEYFSPYMTMAFDLKEEYHSKLPAVIHPADKTARPQMLVREANPGYHEIISEFKKRTGLGVVLNTSFNLHGDAIVESPDDALNTFEKSDLDVLLFDHVAISRVGVKK